MMTLSAPILFSLRRLANNAGCSSNLRIDLASIGAMCAWTRLKEKLVCTMRPKRNRTTQKTLCDLSANIRNFIFGEKLKTRNC